MSRRFPALHALLGVFLCIPYIVYAPMLNIDSLYDPFRYYASSLSPPSVEDSNFIALLRHLNFGDFSLYPLVMLSLLLLFKKGGARCGYFLPIVKSGNLIFFLQTGRDSSVALFLVAINCLVSSGSLLTRVAIAFFVMPFVFYIKGFTLISYFFTYLYCIFKGERRISLTFILSIPLILAITVVIGFPSIEAIEENSYLGAVPYYKLLVTSSISYALPIEIIFRSLYYFIIPIAQPIIIIYKSIVVGGALYFYDLVLSLAPMFYSWKIIFGTLKRYRADYICLTIVMASLYCFPHARYFFPMLLILSLKIESCESASQ